MAGHGEKLSRKQEAAISALLVFPTVEAAAADCGVGYRTLRGWLQRSDFLAAYRQARRAIVESAIGGCQRAASEAVDTLRRNLTCGRAAAEIMAARTILERAVCGVELVDLLQRVEDLEDHFGGKK